MHNLKLSHYAAKQFDGPIELRAQSQHERHKPLGFWISVDGEDDWPSWCVGEDFRLYGLRYRHIVKLAQDADVLWLQTSEDIRMFTHRYNEESSNLYYKYIRWHDVAQEYDGIIIAPYQWSCRNDDDTFWYYSWDCASGVIWEPRAIESVTFAGETDYHTKRKELSDL